MSKTALYTLLAAGLFAAACQKSETASAPVETPATDAAAAPAEGVVTSTDTVAPSTSTVPAEAPKK